MLHKKSFRLVLSCLIAAALSFHFASLAQATDSRSEIKTPGTDTQPTPQQPQQATPTQPSSGTEPVDDDDTALA